MSIIPPEQLEGPNLIAQFIIEYRGRGHFLPYEDHSLIVRWLERAGSADELLLVLSDIIPDFYAKAGAQGKHPPALQRLDRKITQILEARVRHNMSL